MHVAFCGIVNSLRTYNTMVPSASASHGSDATFPTV